MAVYWLLTAQERLRAELHGQPNGLEAWLPRLNAVLAEVFLGQVVLVRDRYAGYRPFDGLVILFVEVQPAPDSPASRFPSPGTYIVKIAFDARRAALKHEIDAWNNARPAFFNGDNVFVSLEAFPNSEDPAALVYGDASAVLGQRNILTLEEAISQSCRFGVPKPDSVERILRTLYERLNSRFFAHSHLEEPSVYLTATRPSLDEIIDRFDETAPPAMNVENKHDDLIRQIRRETLAMLAADHEIFADPIDLLRGLKTAAVGPPILRGTSHGDLHARNIQVAIVNDDVSQCAVFDYEKFSVGNFVAWDFIKLEVETAVRLLDSFGSRCMPIYAKECMQFWHRVGQRAELSDPRAGQPATMSTDQKGRASERLEDLLVALRGMAHEHLGRNRNRAFDWEAEYELLLAWYGVRAALYPNYEPRWRIAALAAGGVAARRLMRRMPAEVELSHRRRFIAAKNLARGIESVAAGADALNSLGGEFPHVLEIQEELALAHIKLRRFKEAEGILDEIANRYRSDHTTAETPSLLGSLWKRRAYAVEPFDRYALDRSLTWYRRAADRHHSDEFYPRINVATLMLIQNRLDQARQEARRVLELLEQYEPPDFWAMATRGEATLLLGEDVQTAFEHYRHAVNDRDCRPMDRQTMRDQIVFLRPHFAIEVQTQITDDKLAKVFQPIVEGNS